MKKIRVLIVDDSAFMRKAIKRMLGLAPDIDVVDTASDGREALQKIAELRPDIVTLDVRMSGMDGITALEHIMKEHPVPVLMLSSLTHEGAEVTLRALELGAVDFVDKSRAESTMDISQLANELIAKVRTIAGVDIEKMRLQAFEPSSHQESAIDVRPATTQPHGGRQTKVDVVAIGTSTGGPPALQALITKLPADFPAGVLVVQHMPVGFTKPLADRLNTQSHLSVSEAIEGDIVRPGRVLIAPAGHHLKLMRRNGQYIVHLDEKPADALHKPSVDVMMEYVAKACGARSLGVLLTGMGSDGAKGMRAIKETGGRTLAESEETCIVYGMPKSAVEDGVVDKVVPLYQMVTEIQKEV